MKKTLLALAGILVLAACSLQPANVTVDVEEIPSTDRWRVTLRHAEPSSTFVFPRTRQPFRAGKWSIVEPPSGRWETVDGFDAVVADRPFDRIVLDLPSDFTLLEKDYRLNVPFTDGSRLLYTGHFRTRRQDQTATPPHDFTFVSAPSRTIRILGTSGERRLAWSTRDDETYVYFGAIRPESTPRVTLIVDPGLPEWVEAQMRELVPRQFDYFARKTGFELPFKPLIVVSYGGPKGSGRTFSAGGLQGMLEIGISGEQWVPRTPEAERYWFRHLAHEAFHLWGAQANRHAAESEWLSEGSAEYASVLAAIDAGVFQESDGDRFVVQAANECLARLGSTPLRESLGPGQSRNVYTCGVVSQKIVDAAARKAGSDIWEVWRRTYEAPGPYTTDQFIEAVRITANDPSTTAFVHDLVVEGLADDAAQRMADRLRGSGMNVSLVDGKLRLP